MQTRKIPWLEGESYQGNLIHCPRKETSITKELVGSYSDDITQRNLDLLDERYLRSFVSTPKDSEELESLSIKPRVLSLPPMVWTLKPSKTFLQITLTQIIGGGVVQQLLHGAAQVLSGQVQQFGGVDNILNSKFTYSLSPQLSLSMWNWNNRKMDLKVVYEATTVLYNFMANRGFGIGTFTIYTMIPGEGAVAVGQGSIGSIPR